MSDFDLMISIAKRLADDRASLKAEVDRQRTEIERLHQAHQAACEGGDLQRAEVERLRAAARNALNELNCSEEDGGHRCIRCDSEIDEGHHVRLALRNLLEGKP